MAFPSGPTNGQTTTINNISYTYNSTVGAWQKSGAVATASPVSSVAGRTGAVTLTGSDIGSGTMTGPITVSGAFTVTGASTLAAVGGTTGTFSSTLAVTGAATLSSTLAVTGATTLTSTCQTSSLGVGTAPSGTAGQILATNSITAYYSDKRLKTEVAKIENALDKIDQLCGVIYTQNQLAEQFGYNNYDEQVGLYAQDVQIVQPQCVKPAPFDVDANGNSKSGNNYLTVQYEKLVPLLVEGIKELRKEINKLKG